jgi:hypothetical protein
MQVACPAPVGESPAPTQSPEPVTPAEKAQRLPSASSRKTQPPVEAVADEGMQPLATWHVGAVQAASTGVELQPLAASQLSEVQL